MGTDIIVAGAGHGGLSAAYALSKNGYNVTVYERSEEEKLGHDWHDYFEVKSFSAAGFPLPSTGVTDRIPIAYYGPDPDLPPLCQNDQAGVFEMYMPRKDIYKHLISHCRKAGVKFVFGCNILGPAVLGDRVVGIKTSLGDFYADLVVDSAGIDSPLRKNLSEYFLLDKEFKKYDILYTYRGIYKRLPDVDFDGPVYRVYLSDDGSVGLKWCVTYDDYVDILIGRFEPFGSDTINSVTAELRKINPHLSDELIRGGQVVKIPVRQSPAVLVANGYASVGDSAAMTMPLMGSGIASSLKAGAMLAKAVIADKNRCYSAETLWKYEVDYMKNIGFNYASVALIKDLLPSLKKEDVDFFFREGILTSSDMAFSAEDSSLGALLTNITIPSIIERARKATANPALLKKVAGVGVNFVKLKSVTSSFPTKYNRLAIEKWAEKYTSFFESVLDRSI